MNKKLNFTNMKNIYIILSLLFVTFTSMADATFNNATGDGKWSTIGNWAGGLLPTNADKVILMKSVTLDVNATVKQLKNGTTADDVVVVTGETGKVLTITGAGVGQPIQVQGAGKTLDLTGVVLDITSTDASEALAVNANNSTLKLGSWTTATLTNLLASAGVNNPRTIELDGALTSTKWLQFKTNSTIVFGANYDGTGHTNNMRFLDNANGPARVTVKGSNWLKAGRKLIVVKTGTLTVDGENALKGQIEIQNANNLNLNVNKNQSGAQTITIGSGNLNLTMGDDVTSLAFADNSAANWGTGKIVITNFKDNVISFGSDASGLTAAQLAKIDIGGGNVVIGSDGKLAVENNEVAASTFKNTTGDSLWTTAGNWSNGIPNVTTAKVTVSKSMILDADIEVAQIKLDNSETGVDVLIKSNTNKTLTLSGTGVSQPIQNNRGNATFNLNLKVVMNSTDAVETIQASSAGTCNVTFGASSDLTLNVPTKFVAQLARTIEFNGIIRNTGTGEIQVGAASTVNFGSTSDNSNYTGDIKLLGKNTNLVSNTADDGTFLVANSAIVPDGATSEGHNVTINGKNTFKGNITVLDTAVTLTVNADQSSAGLIGMGKGNLNLVLDTAKVTQLKFADNSSSGWGTGKLVISPFKNNVVSFGTDANGITAAQLNQIDIGGGLVSINASGQISEKTLSQRLNPGDIAFTGIVAEGTGGDNLSFVAMKDLEKDVIIFFRDDEVSSDGSFNGTGEGSLEWKNNSGAVIPAGTSIVFDSLNSGTMTASVGSLTKLSQNRMNLSTSGDGVWAYQTTTDVYNSGTNSFVALIVADENKSLSGSSTATEEADLTAWTGLAFGTNAVNISGGTGSPDGGKHDRGVTGGMRDALLAEINSPDNWTTSATSESTNGDGDTMLPLSRDSYTIYPSPRLSAGDIAFTGLVSEGSGGDNISFVILKDVEAGVNFFLRDDEVQIDGKFNGSGEGTVKWENTTGAVITAGTSVVIDSLNSGTITASTGTATKVNRSMNLSTSGDGVFAYQTSTDVFDTGTNSFIALVSAAAGKSFSGTVDDSITVATGLEWGTNAIEFSGTYSSPDGGKHDRGVTTGSREQLLAEINSADNWVTSASSSDAHGDGSTMLPLSSEAYVVTASPVYVPTVVKLTATSGSVNESAGPMMVSVDIVNPYPLDSTTVELVFVGTDSTDLSNFVSDTIIWGPGQTDSQSASIPILNDTDIEGEETFTFKLRNVTGGYQSSIGSDSIYTLTILDDDLDFSFVYNELHIDPASDITGDANGDGTRNAIEDEFVELVNTGAAAFDLSGYYMTDNAEPNLASRHTFPQGTVVDAGQAIVVFGGGTPTSPTNFGGSVVQTASEDNGGVGLGNSDRTLYIKNADGLTVLSQSYDASQGNINQSITRSPDLTGNFVTHSGVLAANGNLFSPGMKLDSTAFYTHTSTKVQFQVMRATYREGDDATVDIAVTINGASATNATEVTVGLIGGTGTADDIGGYSSQTLTFAAGSTATQKVTLTVADDDLQEGNETFEFELTSPTGGESAAVASPSKFTLTLADDDISNPLILNEVLTDPPIDDTSTPDVNEGDANGDGTRDYSDDEFVELVNTNTTELDISGYTVSDMAAVRHTFAEGSILSGGGVALLFGGGTPTGSFGGAEVVATADYGSLGLNNSGDKLTVKDKDGNIIIEFEWGGSTIYEGGARQSLTRDPDLIGDFVLHSTTVAGGLFSPGTQSSGSPFDVGLNDPTKVQFKVSEFTYANEDGTYSTGDYDIVVEISNASTTVATQVEVVFTASDIGNASDISDYSGEVLTFSTTTPTNEQTSTVTISSSNIELGTKYDFALQNVSGGNQASLGENTTFTLTIGDPGAVPLGIENSRSDITLSSNPTSDILKVSINNNKVLERFIINDMNGRSIITRSFGKVVDKLDIDVRSFDNGLYILNLEFDNSSAKLKFIKK